MTKVELVTEMAGDACISKNQGGAALESFTSLITTT